MARTLPGEPSMIKVFNQRWIDWISELARTIRIILQDRDTHVTIANANLGKGTTAPTQVIVGNYTGWSFNINDDAVVTIELPHDINDDMPIGVHFTFVINEAYATRSAEVQFQATYSCVSNSGESVTSPPSSGTLTTGDINIPATAQTTYHSTQMSIPAADYVAGDTIGITFSRIALTAGTNPVANPVVINLHLEYTRKTTDWYGE